MRGLNDHVESSPTKTAKRPGNAGIAAFIPGVTRRCWEKNRCGTKGSERFLEDGSVDVGGNGTAMISHEK